MQEVQVLLLHVFHAYSMLLVVVSSFITTWAYKNCAHIYIQYNKNVQHTKHTHRLFQDFLKDKNVRFTPSLSIDLDFWLVQSQIQVHSCAQALQECKNMKMKKIHPGILKWRPKNMLFAEFIPCSRKIQINLRAMCIMLM